MLIRTRRFELELSLSRMSIYARIGNRDCIFYREGGRWRRD